MGVIWLMELWARIRFSVWLKKHPYSTKYKVTITKANGDKLPENEPIFFFRGQDQFAPQVLAFYAGLVQSRTEANNKVVKDAKDYMTKMLNWPVKKFPD